MTTTEQLGLPGLAEGRRLRDEGLAKVQRDRWVWDARCASARIAHEQGHVTSDDFLDECPTPEYVTEKAVGSVLRKPWFIMGSQTQTRRPQGHARWIHRWHLTAKGREELL